MSFPIFLSLTFLLKPYFISSEVQCKTCDTCADYYWRDYCGVIPYDAVPAGSDTNGNLRYVGMVYIQGFELLPATILPELGVARTTAYTQVLERTTQIRILCGPFKSAFKWIPIKNSELSPYSQRIFIPGGSETGITHLIGRVFRNNDVYVGKRFQGNDTGGMAIPIGDRPVSVMDYDILTYDCQFRRIPYSRSLEVENETIVTS